MKEKKIIIISISILLGIIIFILIKNNSYAVDENIINIKKEKIIYNEEKLNEDITNIVNDISSIIIPNASYEDSDILTENYDFLTIFAINYILRNKEYYNSKIINDKEYQYEYYNYKYTTFEYIDINEIYNITDIFFGKKYYYITNDYLKVEDNKIPLLLIKDKNIDLEIEKIKLEKNNNYINSYVKYKNNDLIYNFIFKNKDNYLVLYNITFEENQ